MMYSKIENYRKRLVNILNDFEGTIKPYITSENDMDILVKMFNLLRDNVRDESIKDGQRLSNATAERINKLDSAFQAREEQRASRVITRFLKNKGIMDKMNFSTLVKMLDAFSEAYFETYLGKTRAEQPVVGGWKSDATLDIAR